jgi:hypothetical protein
MFVVSKSGTEDERTVMTQVVPWSQIESQFCSPHKERTVEETKSRPPK